MQVDGPLKGVNLLDFGLAGVGPWGCTLLSMLGANVLKVERPDGDLIRTQPPFKNKLGVGYTVWNMAKKGSIFDLKDPKGRKDLEPLVKEADILCENLRAGVMDRLGLSFEDAQKVNPKIIIAASRPWGSGGPMVDWPAVDGDIQVFSGFASLTGEEGGRPEMARHMYHFDLNASGTLAATAILGLLQRDRTGEAQYVSSTHLGTSLTQLSSRIAEYLLAGKIPGTLGSASSRTAPHQAFQCQDKKWISVGIETEKQWQAFCKAIQREDMLDAPHFKTNRARVEHRKELAHDLEKVFASCHSRWWFVQLSKYDVPVGYFWDFEDLRTNEHVLENQYIMEMDFPQHEGKLYVGGSPWQFSKTPGRLYRAPFPGEHTEEVKAKGFSAFGVSKNSEPRYARKGNSQEPPLSGIRVIDATQGICGPFTGLQLADAGADVIKVEPLEGDYARAFAPGTKTGDSAAFIMLNRNKKSIMLNLETEKGSTEFKNLVQNADVILEDWGPGKARSLGLDYDLLSKFNPGLIYCAITPFGEKGPLANLKGSELVIQGMTDYWGSLGQVGSPPIRWGNDAAEQSTGTMAFVGILAALYHRNRTGEGQRLGISQFGVLVAMRQACWSVMGDLDRWEGMFCLAYTSPRQGGWQTKDVPVYMRMYNATEEQYVSLLIDFGMEEVLADPMFANGGRDATGNGKYAVEVTPIWERYLKNKTSDEVVQIARSHNAMALPMNSVKDVVHHPQAQALDMLKEMDYPGLGKVQLIGPAITGAWKAPNLQPTTKLGEHSAKGLSSTKKK